MRTWTENLQSMISGGTPAQSGMPSPQQVLDNVFDFAVADKRAALIRLCDARLIDDIVLRRVQSRLDAEEMRRATTHESESD